MLNYVKKWMVRSGSERINPPQAPFFKGRGKTWRCDATSHGGFTLIELAVTAALMAILAIGIAPSLYVTMNTYDLIRQRRYALSEARAGMQRMVQEIRLIDGSSDVTTISAGTFTYAYPTGTAVTLTRSGSNITRNGAVLMDNATALTFGYYDSNDVATAVTANVRRVNISFTITMLLTPALTLTTDVFLRNTGTKYVNFETF